MKDPAIKSALRDAFRAQLRTPIGRTLKGICLAILTAFSLGVLTHAEHLFDRFLRTTVQGATILVDAGKTAVNRVEQEWARAHSAEGTLETTPSAQPAHRRGEKLATILVEDERFELRAGMSLTLGPDGIHVGPGSDPSVIEIRNQASQELARLMPGERVHILRRR